MEAPSRWAALAVARPMPEVPPRTTTRCPFIIVSCSGERRPDRPGVTPQQDDAGQSVTKAHPCHRKHDWLSGSAMAFDARLLSGIQVLVAAVETGSFVRAAASLGLTQSGVSRAVARLEQRVGIRLFDRTARAVALTDEGRSFYQRGKPLLTGIEDAATEAAGSAAVVRGRLRVNVDPFFARLVLAPRLGKFLAAYPELSLEIVGRDRLGDLVADGFDAAVRLGEPEASALVARRLLEARVRTCAAPAYLAKHGCPAHPGELGGTRYNCIQYVDPAVGRPFPWE